MTRGFASLLLTVVLSACGSRPNSDVLQLHCRGDRVVDAQPVQHGVNKGYRIDRRASVLEDWNPETGQFVRWGAGRLSISETRVTYAGDVRLMDKAILVRREVEFDRSRKRIVDHAEGSWGSVTQFNGSCEERQAERP